MKGRYLRYPAALVLLVLGICIYAQDAASLVISGNARLQKKDYFGAITDFVSALKTDPSNTQAFFG